MIQPFGRPSGILIRTDHLGARFACLCGGRGAPGAAFLASWIQRMSVKSWLPGLSALLLVTACLGTDSVTGPPATLQVVAGAGQTAKVGTPLAVAPAVEVLDDHGNAIAGTVVIFSVQAGSGTVSGGTVTSGADGIATVGGWTLGTVIGEQTLVAQVQSLQIQTQIAATATSGSASGLTGIAPLKYAALTSTAISPLPTVQVTDSFGNPQSGTQVTFTVTQGGGTVTGATGVTGANGRVTVGSWTLGIAAGVNRLQASIPTGATVNFDAQGLGSPPTQLVATSPVSQSGPLAFQVEKTPRVMVENASGQILPNVPVTFSLVGGGDATISEATGISGSDGVAFLGDWKLGAITASSSVQASIPGFPGPTALFQATGSAQPFTIDLRLLTAMTANQRDAFVTAALRWMKVITGGLSSVTISPGTVNTNSCGTGTPAFSGDVQNVIIWAQVVSIDGPGGILASSGPCVHRKPSFIPAIGSMRFDAADLANLDTSGRMVEVVTHEMAHVLGFGTEWDNKGLTSGQGGSDPTYIGAAGLGLWPTFTMNYAGTPIPIENSGGSGTVGAHWRKNNTPSQPTTPIFGTELMTGYIEASGIQMPLSKLTIAVLQDLGYTVDYSQADSYHGNLYDIWANLGSGASVPLNEVIEQARFEVTVDGKVSKVIRPQ